MNPNEVGDIVVGTVLAPGSQRAIECRIAAFYAGFPGNFLLFFYIITSAMLKFDAFIVIRYLSRLKQIDHVCNSR